jgi:hypothetical protein
VISGTAVVVRRASRRDRGWPEIPGKVADNGVGAVARAVVGGAGGIRGTCAEGRREEKMTGVSGR